MRISCSIVLCPAAGSVKNLADMMHIKMGREEGGGFRMGNTCIPVADSF